MAKKIPYDLVIGFLETASEEMGNASCNDFEIKDTPANRKLLKDAHEWNGDLEENLDDDGKFEFQISEGMIQTSDFFICDYLIHLLKEKVNGPQ